MPLQHLSKSQLLDRYNIFKKTPRVCIGVCVHRDISPETFYCLNTLYACRDLLIGIRMERGDALIARSRSILASKFLKDNLEDILLFIDDDIIFSINDVIKITQDITKEGLDIVGGAYVTKSDIQPTLQQKIFKDQEIRFGVNSKPVEVRYVSTGFMAISRNALEIISKDKKLCYPQEFYAFFQTFEEEIEDKNRFLGEDWYFCETAKRYGLKSYLDPSIQLGHVGKYIYTIADIHRPKRVEYKESVYSEDYKE